METQDFCKNTTSMEYGSQLSPLEPARALHVVLWRPRTALAFWRPPAAHNTFVIRHLRYYAARSPHTVPDAHTPFPFPFTPRRANISCSNTMIRNVTTCSQFFCWIPVVRRVDLRRNAGSAAEMLLQINGMRPSSTRCGQDRQYARRINGWRAGSTFGVAYRRSVCQSWPRNRYASIFCRFTSTVKIIKHHRLPLFL